MNVEKELLIAFARQCLSHFLGHGWWITSDKPRYTKPENPMPGLKFGDTVWGFNDDDRCLEADVIVAVVDGVGFTLLLCGRDKPELWPVEVGDYARTKEEAIELFRDDIAKHIEWLEDDVATLAALKQLLAKD